MEINEIIYRNMTSKNGAFRKRAMDAYVSVTIHVIHVTYYTEQGIRLTPQTPHVVPT